MVDIDALRRNLIVLSAECKTLGTPFTVRRTIKDALAVLPRIEEAREKQR